MPRTRKSAGRRDPGAVPAEILDQFVRDGPLTAEEVEPRPAGSRKRLSSGRWAAS